MFCVDWGKFSFKMTKLIAEKIKDPSLREWILPSFTTTTKVDEAVAAILMMATFQKYFSYGCTLVCGLPSVTLLGQKSDWEELQARAERLPEFGEEPGMWYGLLKPVLAGFVNSFDEPETEGTIDFWQKVVHYSGGGSGPTYLSVSMLIVLDIAGTLLIEARDGSPHSASGEVMASHCINLEATPALGNGMKRRFCNSMMRDTIVLRQQIFLPAGLLSLSSKDNLIPSHVLSTALKTDSWCYSTYSLDILK